MADDDSDSLTLALQVSVRQLEQQWQRAAQINDKAMASVVSRVAKGSSDMNKALSGALANVNARNSGASVDGLTRALKLSNLQILELGHSARSTFDILASGQSPLRALQLEGARLVQALAEGQGGIGGAIEGIGAAVAGLATPVNLALAAVAALGVGAVLWLTSEHDKTVDASAALEAHKKWLDQILQGYDDTKKAADAYLDAANKLPEAAVASDLSAKTAPAMANLQTALGQLQRYRDELSTDLQQGVEEFGSQGAADSVAHLVDVVKQAGLAANSTKAQYDALVTSLTEIANGADKFGPTEAFLAGKMLDLVTNAEKAKTAVDSIGVSLNNLPSSVTVQIGVQMTGFDDARKKLLSLVPDERDEFTKARDDAKVDYNKMLGAAPDAIMRTAAGNDYSKVLAGIDAAQKASEAKKSGTKSESAAERQQKTIDKVTASLQRQIAAIGESGKAQAEANAVAEAGVTAGSKQASTITALAGRFYNLKQAQDANNQAAGEFASLTGTAFESLIKGGQSLGDIFDNLVEQLAEAVLEAELLGQGPLAGILGTTPSTSGAPSGILGNFFSSILGGLHLAGGGPVRGPGGPTADRVPAMLSDGEFVVRASAAAKFGPLLTAINSGRIGHFASGGAVNAIAARSSSVPTAMSAGPAIQIHAPVTVNANGGDPAANADLARQTAEAVTEQFGALFSQHLMKSARPGEVLFGMLRGQS